MKQKILFLNALVFFSTILYSQNTLPVHGGNNSNPHNRKGVSSNTIRSRFQMPHSLHQGKRNTAGSLLRTSTEQKQRLDSVNIFLWDDQLKKYNVSEVDRFFYEDGSVTGEKYEVLNDNYIGFERYKLVFNNKDLVTEEYGFDWDSEIEEWVESYKDEYIYDVNDNLIRMNFYYYDEYLEEWVIDSKSEFTYDLNGNVLRLEKYKWSDEDDELVYQNKYEYTYSVNKNLTEAIEYTWFKLTNSWGLSGKYEFSYDSKNNQTQQVTYNYNQTTQAWNVFKKSVYFYDANNNPIKAESYDYDATKSQFVLKGQYDYTYDLSVELSSLIIPTIDWLHPYHSDRIVNKLLTTNIMVNRNNVMTNDIKEVYHYNVQPVATEEDLIDQNNQLFPNPVTDHLTINLSNSIVATFELSDLQGRVVLVKEVSKKEVLNLNELKEGVYMYTLYSNGEKQNGKLVKK